MEPVQGGPALFLRDASHHLPILSSLEPSHPGQRLWAACAHGAGKIQGSFAHFQGEP